MARLSSVVLNSARSFAFQMGGLLATVILGIVLARTLGPAGKALVGYAAVGLSMATIFFNGLSEAISYQFGRKKLPMATVHRAMLFIALGMTPIVLIVLLGAAFTLPSQRVLIAAAIAFPFALYTQIAVPFFMLRDRIIIANYQQVLTSVGYAVVASFAAIVLHAGVVELLAVWIGITVLAAIYTYIRLIPIVHAATKEEQERKTAAADLGLRETIKDQLRFTWKAGFASVASFINLRIDVIIVSLMLPARLLGIYTLAIAMGELMWKISQAITWSSLGRIASESPQDAAILVTKITRNLFALQCSAGIFAFIFGPYLLTLVYGEAFAQAGIVLRFLLPGLVLYTLEGPIGYYLMIHEGKALLRVAVQSGSIILCAVVSIATIHTYSIAGAALATTLSYLCVISFMTWAFSRSTGMSLRDIFILHRSDFLRYGRLLHSMRAKAGKLGQFLGMGAAL